MKKIFIVITLLSSFAFANQFGAGNKALGITFGSGSVSYEVDGLFKTTTNVENYYILGVGADYFVFENLSVGVGYRGWFGGTPTIHQGTVPVTYYIPTNSRYRPYLGALYRYTYFDNDIENYNSVGARAGLAITFQSGYVGFGWLQEYRLDADNLSDDTSGYPEVVIGFSF